MKNFLLFIFLSTSLFGTVYEKQALDYSKFQSGLHKPIFENEAYSYGFYAFNFAPELIPFFATLKKDYNIPIAVETGTYIGGTSVALSLLFEKVHTVEVVGDTYQKAQKNLAPFKNVEQHFGSSEMVLKDLLPELKDQRVLFYLDAHWQQHWPLLQELAEIGKTHRDNCIIVIDDFKVPGRPEIPYDAYGTNECSYEYIKKQLESVYSSYDYFYLIPRSINSRAKFVAVPRNWAS